MKMRAKDVKESDEEPFVKDPLNRRGNIME